MNLFNEHPFILFTKNPKQPKYNTTNHLLLTYKSNFKDKNAYTVNKTKNSLKSYTNHNNYNFIT